MFFEKYSVKNSLSVIVEENARIFEESCQDNVYHEKEGLFPMHYMLLQNFAPIASKRTWKAVIFLLI